MALLTRILTVFCLFLCANVSFAQAGAPQKIKICMDTNFWYPFTFLKDNKPSGLHIDIIDAALKNLNYTPVYEAKPWEQCLDAAKAGSVDAVATASYRDDRAVYLNYPEGAAVDHKSPFRVSQVTYILVTPTLNKDGQKNTYEFKGDLKSIPEPIRVPANYSIGKDLRDDGLTVKDGKNSLYNFEQLVKEQTGTVIDIEDLALHIETQPGFKGKFIIQQKHLKSKSYFLAFAKSSKIDKTDEQAIWKAIQKVRENSNQMADFLRKY